MSLPTLLSSGLDLCVHGELSWVNSAHGKDGRAEGSAGDGTVYPPQPFECRLLNPCFSHMWLAQVPGRGDGNKKQLQVFGG